MKSTPNGVKPSIAPYEMRGIKRMGWVINPEGVELLQSIDKVSSYFNSKPPISFGFCFRPHTDKDVRIKISKGKEILCFGCFEEVFFGIGIEKPILSKGI